MSKWIFILKLFGSDIETGEMDWYEKIRVENLPFQICIESVVDTVNTMRARKIRHEVYCEEMPEEENKDK